MNGSQMEESSPTEHNEHAAELENSEQFPRAVKSENESSTFDFAEGSWMSDFVLIVEGTRFYLAKNILALASPVFERMFKSEFKECSLNELELPGKTKKDMLEFLRCIYPDAPENLTRETVLGILPLTEEYQVSKLKGRCEKALIESIDSTTSALELLQILQQSSLYELKDLRKKCVELVSEKSTGELDEAKQEYELPAEALVEILGKDIEKLKVKNMELEELNEKQRKYIEELGNEKATTQETLEVIQQYFANECKVSLAKDIDPFRGHNWRSEQVVLIVNLKNKGVAAVKEVILWDIPLEVAASVDDNLNIRIENKGMTVSCNFAINAILVCRQSTGKNVRVSFSGSFYSRYQYIEKQFKKVSEINAADDGFMRHGKIGLIIQLYMSEPNTE